MRKLVAILLLAHVLGDYYFQDDSIAEKKRTSYAWVLIHCAVYALVDASVSLLLVGASFATVAVPAAAAHWVIDTCKYIACRKSRFSQAAIYMVDQAAHMLAILAVAYLCGAVFRCRVDSSLPLYRVPNLLGLQPGVLLRWLLCLLLVHKPANVTIQALLSGAKGAAATEAGDRYAIRVPEINAGRYIGTAERLIMLFLIANNSLVSLGFVLTAKSMVRYSKIAEDSRFAEYYLIGTLLSTLCAFGASILLKV